jgi:Arc/MetJ-type ribon-helix-helix transcriptional regulator
MVKRARELVSVKEKKAGRGLFSSMSLPTPLTKEIERVVDALGYWPNKTAFVREAVMEKMEKHKKELEARRLVAEEVEKVKK